MLRHFLRCGLAFVAIVTAHLTRAGTVEQAVLLAEPQMQIKSGAVDGCGFRIKAMPEAAAGTRSVVLLDASFNLYATGLSLLKGGAIAASMRDGQAAKPENRPIESFWFMTRDSAPTAPLNGRFLAAETAGYLLAGVTLSEVADLFGAVLGEANITIGVRIKGESVDRIYTGTATLSDADKAQSSQCMDRLVKRMQSESDARERAAPGR